MIPSERWSECVEDGGDDSGGGSRRLVNICRGKRAKTGH